MDIAVNNVSSVETPVSQNNSISINTVNYTGNSFEADLNTKQNSIKNRIVAHFKAFSGNTIVDNIQTNKDFLAFFNQTRKEFIKYKKDIFSHYKYMQLNNIKLKKAEYYFCYFHKNLVNLRQNLQKEGISKKAISNDINSNFNEKNLKKAVNGIISYLDNAIEKLSTKKPTTAKKIWNCFYNIFAYILTKFDSIITYIRGKINLLISIFSNSKKNYIDINKYQIPYNSTVDNKPEPIKTLEPKPNNKANMQLLPQSEIKSPKNETAKLNELELKKQGISLSRMVNYGGKICWLNSSIKLFYRMQHKNINDIINNYKKFTDDILDEGLIKKRNNFLNSLEILFDLLKANKDVEQNSYNFMNNLYIYAASMKKSIEEKLTSTINDPNAPEEFKNTTKNKYLALIEGTNSIKKLFEEDKVVNRSAGKNEDSIADLKNQNGISHFDFSLVRQQQASEFIVAMMDFLKISNETNEVISVVQVSLCFDNNIGIENNNHTKIIEIKRKKIENQHISILHSELKPETYNQPQQRSKSAIIQDIADNQQYNDFDIQEANALKSKLKKEIETSGDIKINVNFKTRKCIAGNIDKLTELLVEFQASDGFYNKDSKQIQEAFANSHPIIEFELADKNNLQNKYKIKARAKSIILHSGRSATWGHYLTFNIDKNGKAILHDGEENKNLNELYLQFLGEKIPINQFNKKTEQEKLAYIIELYKYDPHVVLYEVIDKQLISNTN